MAQTVSSDSVAQDQLRSFVERIERIHAERDALGKDLTEIYGEAKGNGFDTKVMKKVVQIRKQDHSERMEQEAILELYMAALGMQAAPLDEDDDEPRVQVQVRARENIEQFDPPTGEITEGVDTTDTLLCSGGAEAARQVHTLEVAGASPAPATNEGVAATETAPDYLREPPAVVSGQIAEEGDAPLEADTHVSSEAVTGEHLGTEFPTPAGGDNTTEPERKSLADLRGVFAGEPLKRVTLETEAPAKRQWKQSDPAHLDCLHPEQCGGFSNLKLCPGCAAEALSARQVA